MNDTEAQAWIDANGCQTAPAWIASSKPNEDPLVGFAVTHPKGLSGVGLALGDAVLALQAQLGGSQ